MPWRWDQGRLLYFQYDVLRGISGVLLSHEGINIDARGVDPLRQPLMAGVGYPFAPADYRVWRNYARVFECALLATRVDHKLVCTQLSQKVAAERDFTVDDYLAHVVPRFYYPSPVFEDYTPNARQIFPFCAILKLLLSNALLGKPSVSLGEIESRLIGNACTGTERVGVYKDFPTTNYVARPASEGRQVREMLVFLSQFTFLKWKSSNLFLDIANINQSFIGELERLATPVISTRERDASMEILALGRIPGGTPPKIPRVEGRISDQDAEFIEGRKVRVVHLQSERSRKLREFFFRAKNSPYICDMCALSVSHQYPWTDNILELHHLLPLSSPLRIEQGTTSLRDLVGICPTCHRATHIFYRQWLDTASIEDFRSYQEAHQVYEMAKGRVQRA